MNERATKAVWEHALHGGRQERTHCLEEGLLAEVFTRVSKAGVGTLMTEKKPERVL